MFAVSYQSSAPALVRAQSNAKVEPPKVQKKIVRRHSSGDHAFLPDRTQREAIKAAQKNVSRRLRKMSGRSCDACQLTAPPSAWSQFGVPQGGLQDSEGSRLPTTRGY